MAAAGLDWTRWSPRAEGKSHPFPCPSSSPFIRTKAQNPFPSSPTFAKPRCLLPSSVFHESPRHLPAPAARCVFGWNRWPRSHLQGQRWPRRDKAEQEADTALGREEGTSAGSQIRWLSLLPHCWIFKFLNSHHRMRVPVPPGLLCGDALSTPEQGQDGICTQEDAGRAKGAEMVQPSSDSPFNHTWGGRAVGLRGSHKMSKQPAAAAGWGQRTCHRRRPVTPIAVQEGTSAWSFPRPREEEEGGGTGRPEQHRGPQRLWVLRAAPPQKRGFWGSHGNATAETRNPHLGPHVPPSR